MPPQFFVKFQYNDKIKKIGLSEEEFTWDNMTKILSQSFGLPKDRLKLTYKDPEGDEITACCDEDLIEAYKACTSLQPMKFFVYLCNNANSSQEKTEPIKQAGLMSSRQFEQEEPREKPVEQIKSRSECILPDPILMIEKEKVLSDGAIKQEDMFAEEMQTKIGTEEIGRILEEILLTKEAKEKILQLRDRVNKGPQSSSGYKIDIDEKMLADCVTGILDKVLNQTIAIDVDEKVDEKAASIHSGVASLEEIPEKISMSKDWKSMEAEKSYQVKSATQSNIFNTSLKESIYEKSLLSSAKEPKIEDFKERSFAGTSMSFCRDLSSTYGVKLALKLDNGKMKLVSVPTQEYSIIDSVDHQHQDKSEASSNLKRSASMKECPDPKKNVSPDYSEYFRLSLVD